MVAVPLGYMHVFLVLYFLFSRHSAASSSTCDMCLRFRGCPVELDIELFVSARHHKTRVLLYARRLVLMLVAARQRAAVCGRNFKTTSVKNQGIGRISDKTQNKRSTKKKDTACYCKRCCNYMPAVSLRVTLLCFLYGIVFGNQTLWIHVSV